MVFREYPPEINELLESGAGLGIFWPKYYSFSASDLASPTGDYFYGTGGRPLAGSFSTGPLPINLTIRPNEYFWCTTIYASYSENGGGALSGPPLISLKCSEGKKFIDAYGNAVQNIRTSFISLPNVAGPGFIDNTGSKPLYYPAPFRYVFSPYTTITAEIMSPGGNSMNVYITLAGFAQEAGE